MDLERLRKMSELDGDDLMVAAEKSREMNRRGQNISMEQVNYIIEDHAPQMYQYLADQLAANYRGLLVPVQVKPDPAWVQTTDLARGPRADRARTLAWLRGRR